MAKPAALAKIKNMTKDEKSADHVVAIVRNMPERFRARVDKQGRILIPLQLRHELGIGAEDPVTIWSEGGQLHVITIAQALRDIQAMALKLKKPGESVVDEFLRERRDEAEREERE